MVAHLKVESVNTCKKKKNLSQYSLSRVVIILKSLTLTVWFCLYRIMLFSCTKCGQSKDTISAIKNHSRRCPGRVNDVSTPDNAEPPSSAVRATTVGLMVGSSSGSGSTSTTTSLPGKSQPGGSMVDTRNALTPQQWTTRQTISKAIKALASWQKLDVRTLESSTRDRPHLLHASPRRISRLGCDGYRDVRLPASNVKCPQMPKDK